MATAEGEKSYDRPGFIGTRAQARITIFAFIVMSVFIAGAIIFLVLTFIRQGQDFNLKHHCIVGESSLVFPGPGAVAPPAYGEGKISFHRTEPYIEWNILHDLGTVTELDIFGPVSTVNPLVGPVFVVLCKTGTTAPCLFPTPNTLVQRITAAVTSQPLLDIVKALSDHPESYKLRVKTVVFPDGALVFRLNNVC